MNAQRWLRLASSTLVIALIGASVAPAADFSAAERARVLKHLAHTEERLLKAVDGLSPEQATFKPAPDRWSVLECLEHIATGEETLRGVVTELLAGEPQSERAGDLAGKEEEVLKFIVDRTQRFQAPEGVAPHGQFATLEEAVAAFQERRQTTRELVEETDANLHLYVSSGPTGELTAYQWLFFLSGHAERHTLQIKEVLAHQDFPD